MSFGCLSKMVSGMDKSDQKLIATRYSIQSSVLKSWMHHFVYIRNLCAHHSRLWDRSWTIKPELPAGKYWQKPHLLGSRKLFATLLVLRTLMRFMPAISEFASEWRTRVEGHIAVPPPTEKPLETMGLPEDWKHHTLWV
jgi:abortive infection bacteriophage resistance protein